MIPTRNASEWVCSSHINPLAGALCECFYFQVEAKPAPSLNGWDHLEGERLYVLDV